MNGRQSGLRSEFQASQCLCSETLSSSIQKSRRKLFNRKCVIFLAEQMNVALLCPLNPGRFLFSTGDEKFNASLSLALKCSVAFVFEDNWLRETSSL